MSHLRALPFLVTTLCLLVLGDHSPGQPAARMKFGSVMPQTVLWAWEEPEDLRTVSSDSIGVAYLAESLFLGQRPALKIVPRHQPLIVAPGTPVMAVVRVMALSDFHDSADLRGQTAHALARVAQQHGVRALQIDFDATRSQRWFYADVLRQLRPRMPAGMPLSITALLSWCAAAPGEGDWLAKLPIDEAVPMFFRLGGRSRPADGKSGYPVRERLCLSSLGISTDESWPRLNARERIYLFSPRPWTALQLQALNGVRSGHRPSALLDSSTNAQLNDTGLPPPNPSQENLP